MRTLETLTACHEDLRLASSAFEYDGGNELTLTLSNAVEHDRG